MQTNNNHKLMEQNISSTIYAANLNSVLIEVYILSFNRWCSTCRFCYKKIVYPWV